MRRPSRRCDLSGFVPYLYKKGRERWSLFELGTVSVLLRVWSLWSSMCQRNKCSCAIVSHRPHVPGDFSSHLLLPLFGFDGPWTFSPITFTNEFYKLLLNEQWYEKSWSGPRQFENDSSKSLMMLPTDKCLVDDKDFKPYVEKYAADEDVYFDDFSQALTKLFELGVPFASGEDARIVFERTE